MLVISKETGRYKEEPQTLKALITRCRESIFFYLEHLESVVEVENKSVLGNLLSFSVYSSTSSIVNLFISSQNTQFVSWFTQTLIFYLIFFSFYLFFLILFLFYFTFLFLLFNKELCDCGHITCSIMSHHRFRTVQKKLEQ